MRSFRKRLLGGASAIALAAALLAPAYADTAGTATTQTATRNDAAVFWVGQANGVTTCNAVSQTSASETITITPPAGQYVYLTELLVQRSSDATGVTEVPTLSFTNMSNANGGPAAFLSAASTLATTGYHIDLAIPFPTGMRSSAPGVAVTIVPSAAQATHGILCMSAIGYFNAN